MSEKCPVCNQPINQCSCGCYKPPTPCPPKSPLTTENYHLPLYRASDVTSWLIQFNNAMIDIDKIMHSLALRTNTVPEVSEELISTVEKLESEVQELQLTSDELVTSNGNLAAQVATAMQSLANANQSIQTLMLNTTNLDTRMGTVETNVLNLQTNFTKLQENVNAVAENYTALTDRVETLEAARTDIEEWQESATETISGKLDKSAAFEFIYTDKLHQLSAQVTGSNGASGTAFVSRPNVWVLHNPGDEYAIIIFQLGFGSSSISIASQNDYGFTLTIQSFNTLIGWDPGQYNVAAISITPMMSYTTDKDIVVQTTGCTYISNTSGKSLSMSFATSNYGDSDGGVGGVAGVVYAKWVDHLH